MSGLEMVMRNAKTVEKRIAAEQARIHRNREAAAKAAATVLVPHVRAALPRKTGTLRRHVRVYRVTDEVYKVKVVGKVAHLITGDIKEHEIRPRGLQDAASHLGSRYGRKIQGPVMLKRAIVIAGHPYARALHPAHRGDPTIMPRVRAEYAGEARLAAKEVLLHGR